jgi:diguanylate cyclase (GGDEF)-like protein
LTSTQKWQLLSVIFGQNISLVEGSLTLLIVEAICFYRTWSFTFFGIAAVVSLVLILRLIVSVWYRHANTLGQISKDTDLDAWAGRFTIGAAATALLWGLTDFCVVLGFDDEALKLFVLLIQTGWLGGVVIRNAVSPAVIYCQVTLSILPACIALVLSPHNFTKMVLPFLIIQISFTLRTARLLQSHMFEQMELEQRLTEMNARLVLLSETDGLTGIANRRTFDSRLNVICELGEREPIHVSLLMIDIDYFKLYNDGYGHQAGDEALKAVAACLEKTTKRPSDLVARYGGEEFAVLLPNTDHVGAEKIAERIHSSIVALNLTCPQSPLSRLTVSIGFTSFYTEKKVSPWELVQEADQALYMAKESGRNCIFSSADINSSSADVFRIYPKTSENIA